MRVSWSEVDPSICSSTDLYTVGERSSHENSQVLERPVIEQRKGRVGYLWEEQGHI